MRRLIAALLSALALCGCATAMSGCSHGKQDQRIEEDSPLWNCLTMGNKVCGPQYVPLYQRIDVVVRLSQVPGSSEHTAAECRVAEVAYGNFRYLIVCDDGWLVRL